MLSAAQGGEGKVEKGKNLEEKIGWREALTVDPLLANLHQKLDKIFFPNEKGCQVPIDN